jgi:hypothetical protein
MNTTITMPAGADKVDAWQVDGDRCIRYFHGSRWTTAGEVDEPDSA